MHYAAPAEAGFIRRQNEFAAHIRQPDQQPRPADVEPRRMAIYNELFYNNLNGFMADSFPVLRRITPDDRWQAMTRDFFATHTCRTPLFTRLAEEFLVYLEHERNKLPEDPPFLLQLAHYEWVELALNLSDEDQDLPPIDANGDLLAGHPVISPLAWSLSYDYPVHLISPDYLPEAPAEVPTHLVVYRDRRDRIGFLEINAVTSTLLEILDAEPAISGEAALDIIVQVLGHSDPERMRLAGVSLLNDLRQRDILLGTARKQALTR